MIWQRVSAGRHDRIVAEMLTQRKEEVDGAAQEREAGEGHREAEVATNEPASL